MVPQLPPDIGVLSTSQLETMFARVELLGILIHLEHVTKQQIEERALHVNISKRTIWRYLTAYRHIGLAGLVPRQRSDAGKCHLMSVAVQQQIESLRLTHRDASERHIWELAGAWAKAHQERPPSVEFD